MKDIEAILQNATHEKCMNDWTACRECPIRTLTGGSCDVLHEQRRKLAKKMIKEVAKSIEKNEES